MRRAGLLLIGLGFVGLALPAFDVTFEVGESDWLPVLGFAVLLSGALALWEGIVRHGGLELIDPRAWLRFKKNRGAVAGAILVIFVLVVGFVGPLVAPHPPDRIYDAGFGLDGSPVSPNGTFWFGADAIGRDALSRLLYGGRVSLSVALGAVSIAGTLGFGAGLLSGYFRGFLDMSLMRLVDFLLSLPFLLVAIAVNRVIEDPALWTLCVLLGLLSWTTLGRVTRAKTLQARELEYVQAARALGAGHGRIILRHILPNVLGPAIVIATTMVANMIIVESAMSFLGLGVKPPTASWGTMLSDGQDYLQVIPRLMLVPGALIVATVFGFNMMGEGLRDALDPKDSAAGPRRAAQGSESIAGLAGLGAFALFALVIVFIALFMPNASSAPAYLGAGSETPQRGGTFTFHHESDVRGFDPHISFDELSNMGIKLMFEGLIDYDVETLELVPRIAEAVPEPEEGGRVFRFRLRRDVRFSDSIVFCDDPDRARAPCPGRSLVAEDVRWSIEHMLDHDTASPGVTFFEQLDGLEAYREGEASHIAGVRVLDEHTIEFRLAQPDQTFLFSMAMTFAYPVAREAYEHYGDDIARHPVGTGAFMLDRWEPGVRVEFVRNDNFFIEGEPYVDRMRFILNLDRRAAVLRFMDGDLDHIHRQTVADYLTLRGYDAWAPYRDEHAKVNIWGLAMNCEMAPLDDVHMRRAFAFALNRDRWRRARANRLVLAGQPIPRLLPGFDPDLPGRHRFDLDLAREEMRLAGYPDGYPETLTLTMGDGEVARFYGELIQQDLRQLGVDVEIRQLSFPIWLEQTGTRDTVLMHLGGWSMDYPDASNFLDILFHSRSRHDTDSENKAFYSNPEVDRLLDEARIEVDRERRLEMYREASRHIVDDAPWGFVFSDQAMEMWQPYVRNFRPHAVWSNMYRDIWLDLPRRPWAHEQMPTRNVPALTPFGRLR